MEWSSLGPHLNPTKNLWSIVKMKFYEEGKQYNSKANLWEAFKTTMLQIEPAKVKK